MPPKKHGNREKFAGKRTSTATRPSQEKAIVKANNDAPGPSPKQMRSEPCNVGNSVNSAFLLDIQRNSEVLEGMRSLLASEQHNCCQ